jgi:hypothetical protein
MFAKPQAEHEWFTGLSGEWAFENECIMGPDAEPTKTTGKASIRMLGGLWLVIECSGLTPESGGWSSIMTVGYDPARMKYTGTFIGSMMTHLWIYEGQLDEGGRALTLEVEGPKFDGTGMTRYHDIIEKVDADHWILRSRILNDDGTWTQFMESHHRRVS